ncbi:sigma D regulator [Salinimonas lutimaris]|uniref:sigma D regulator n=1 Tax=Salinimonas lutimaris TaxID=914153 RepID=UPI0010BFD995|nr:sigma D regulator [Salinimonas lutimaris]
MLNQLEKTREKWGGRSATVDNWLHARQALLIEYCRLAGINTRQGTLPAEAELSVFCDNLIDYTSAGHFKIYDLLVSDDKAGQTLKQTIYPQLADTTDTALQFNDDFSAEIQLEKAAAFEQAIARLGEVLTQRFELEDQLISHMFEAHGEKTIAETEQNQ